MRYIEGVGSCLRSLILMEGLKMKFSKMSKEELEVVMSGKGLSSGNSGGGRKEEVLEILKGGLYSVKELGVMVGVSNRNISSVICYLRDDGYGIKKIGNSKLVLWDRIVGGIKVGNRMELGSEGVLVKFDFKEGCFVDEIVVDEVDKKKK